MQKLTCSVSALTLGIISATAMAAPQEVTIWRHQTGEAEMKASQDMVNRFNASQDQWTIVQESIPEGTYTQTVTAAAKAGQLPCILDLDQPLVPNFAWNEFLRPLDGFMDDELLAQINTSGKGTYNGKVYSVGQFDVALSLFTTKSLLKEIGARTPTVDKPWTKDEFMAVLEKIKATGKFPYAFDIEAGNTGEWVPYAWSPMMISWGADLIDRTNYVESDGTLNSDQAIEFAEWMRSLVTDGYIDRRPSDSDGFPAGRVGLQYTGSWAVGRFDEKFGDDLAILPVPDFGNGPSIGGGSWHWAATTACKTPDAAAAFLNHLASAQEIANISVATSLIPTSDKAAALTPHYQNGGKWRGFYEFSGQYAQLRPETPAYAVISSSFDKAMHDVLDGKDPVEALDIAVDNIEASIERNNGYGFPMK
ncbi:sugar ABC transporter substrate-binding protein [Alginatibacterium sediminis]|uniref:Sugar ABC transporter substrate-binding protein n=1 Tax=Alginatibacterium sediminis TaxID=2164068 RepID=A0A420EBD2_9ALTE|nr:sugar ABC transporter substrate-binding protein [Alginatibacterium sediminis]RKF17963.1 sugar ABC transporter substrate-binding protein [Alginatibacterium sediminis]